MIASKSAEHPVAERALSELCQSYWHPIYCYLRSRGYSKEDAEDNTQSFIAEILYGKKLGAVKPEKGKLRAYLLASLKNFLVSAHRRSNAQKRGGGCTFVALDALPAAEQFALELVDEQSPDLAFEKAWARALLNRTRGLVGAAYAKSGKARLFEAVIPYVIEEEDTVPYLEIATKLDVSPGSLRVSVFRMRQKFREVLKNEIADTVGHPEEVNGEISHMMTLFKP